MALARYRSYLGIAKETAHAAGVAPTAATPPADYIPVLDIKPADNIKYLDDLAWRGSMVTDYGAVQGNIYSEFEFNGDVFPDTCGYYFAGLLGDYAQGTFSTATISGAVASGTAVTYTTTTAHGFFQGQTVTIAAVTPTVFNLGAVQIATVPSTTTFTVTSTISGTYTSGGTATPNASVYRHTISTKNSSNGQATSYTLTDFYGTGNNARQYTGCQFGSVDLKFNAEGLLEYTAMANGWASALRDVSSDTLSYTTLSNIPVWSGVTSIGTSGSALAGTAVARLAEGDIKISRPLSPIFTVDGSQSPYQIFQGAISVEGSLKLVLEDDTELNYYLNNTSPSLDIRFTNGTGATQTSIAFHMSKCSFQTAKIDRSKDYVELDVTFKALANTTDSGSSAGYSPIKVTLANAKSTALYA